MRLLPLILSMFLLSISSIAAVGYYDVVVTPTSGIHKIHQKMYAKIDNVWTLTNQIQTLINYYTTPSIGVTDFNVRTDTFDVVPSTTYTDRPYSRETTTTRYYCNKPGTYYDDPHKAVVITGTRDNNYNWTYSTNIITEVSVVQSMFSSIGYMRGFDSVYNWRDVLYDENYPDDIKTEFIVQKYITYSVTIPSDYSGDVYILTYSNMTMEWPVYDDCELIEFWPYISLGGSVIIDIDGPFLANSTHSVTLLTSEYTYANGWYPEHFLITFKLYGNKNDNNYY